MRTDHKDQDTGYIGFETDDLKQSLSEDLLLGEEADDDTGLPEYTEDEADKAFDAKEKKGRRSAVIRRIVLIIAAGVFCYSAFMLGKILLEYKKGNDIYHDIQKNVLNDETAISFELPEGEVEIPFKYDHDALLAINPDGVGYIYMPGVNMRLPIAQTTDNDYYLTRTFDRQYNSGGCLFEDYRITGGLDATNVIIYGHNMNNGSMFGMLHKYKSAQFYNTEGNDVFYIYTADKIMEYRIFSVYICEPDSDTYSFNFSNLTALRAYAANMKSLSWYNTNVDVSEATQIITLSTCADNGKTRLIVHGVYVGEAPLTD